ncbi:MAG: hypothetical protein WA019_06530, partial [Candidatus Moraniibacteriota bacterium]
NNTKQATVNVDWQQNLQRTGNISLTTYLTNWRAEKQSLACDWSNGLSVRDSFNSSSNTGNARKVQANGRYVYMIYAGGTAYDFVIVDAGVAPATMLGSLSLVGNQLDIAISGDYAYVASDDNNGELKIIDISNPNTPVLRGTYNATGNANANGVFVVGTTVYLAKVGGTGVDFHIINASNPSSPSLLGSVDIGGNNAGGNELYVSGNYAYVASPDNSYEIKLVDVSNSASPIYLSGDSINVSGNTDGIAITGFGDNLILGNANGTVYVYDISDPLSMSQISTYTGNSQINDIALGERNESIFLGMNSNTNEELEAVDVESISGPSFLSGYQWGYPIYGVAFAGDSCTIYAATGSTAANPELIILTPYVDGSPPSDITDLATSNPTINSVDLAWTAPGDDGSVGTATSYDVRYSTSAITEGNWSSATQVSGEPIPQIAGSAETMIVTGLSSNVTYYFAIKISDEVPNASGISNVPSATTLDGIPPAAVTNLAVSNPGYTTVDLSWTAPGDDVNVGTATTYDIRYSTSIITESNWAGATQVTGEPIPQIAGTNQSMTVSGLSYGTTYFFAMKTSDEMPNISGISNVVNVATNIPSDLIPPSAITDLALSAASGKSILLTWTAPGDDANIGTATTYDIRYSTALITAANWATATQVTGEPTPLIAGTVQTMRVNGLSWRTTYYFAIRTSDEIPNISGLSNVPSLITRTQASYLTINTATARSNAPTDNTQVINITIQNTATDPAESISITRMSTTWQANNARRLNTIRINGTNYWTGSSAKGVLNTLAPAFTLSSSTTYPITYLDFSTNSIGVNTNSVSFTMSDTSTITSASFNITQ